MCHRCSHSRFQRAFTLVEILVVMVLLVLIAGGLSYFYLGSSKGKGVAQKQTPISVAKDTVCKSNIGQVRLSLSTLKSSDPDEMYPPSLTDLKLPSEVLSCAVGKEPYQYDPATGTVRCIHPGHENY